MMGALTPRFRSSRQTSKPSRSGSITSRRIRSNLPVEPSCRASSPSRATSVSYPWRVRSSVRPNATSGSSSTMRIRGILPFARQREAEDAALSFGTLHFHAAPVGLGDVTNHGQADAGPWDAALASGVPGEELLAEPGLLVAGD